MCGRYVLTTPFSVLVALYNLTAGRPNLQPRWNIAPTQAVPVIRRDGEGNAVALLRWGLIPAWVKDPKAGPPLINARAETVASKPSFRDAYRKRRCIVPADGWYEWQREGKAKQPWYYASLGGEPFAFAGLWERWKDAATGESSESCTIITVAANSLAVNVHDRMPAILKPEDMETWLGGSDEAALAACLAPFPSEGMTARMVSSRVNAVRNDDAACLDPPEPAAAAEPPKPAPPPPPKQPSLF